MSDNNQLFAVTKCSNQILKPQMEKNFFVIWFYTIIS